MISLSSYTILIVGAGGTGGNLLPFLCRLIKPIEKDFKIIIADGDRVEFKNLDRQPYHTSEEGQNKALELAKKCKLAFGVNVVAYPHYIEDISVLDDLLGRKSTIPILVGCVDNNKTRTLFHQYFIKVHNLIYIDSGNTEWSGQIVCGLKAKGRIINAPVGELYPDILESKDVFKSEESCQVRMLSEPQQYVTNLQAAVIVLSYLSDFILDPENITDSNETTFDIKIKAMRSHNRF